MTQIQPEFQHQQKQFLHYLRQPQKAPLPTGFETERLAVYADLLYNKFDESLSSCFPIIRQFLPQDGWRTLLLDFIAEHRCRTPYYRQIPDEFIQYLQKKRDQPDDWPFLAELAHFEWMELQLSIAEAEPAENEPLTDRQLLTGAPVFAPVLQLLVYQWPVHTINRMFLPMDPPAAATHILGFRDSLDQVQFIVLNPISARLLSILAEGLSGEQAFETLALGGVFDDDTYASFLQFGLDVLVELNHRGAIIGVRPSIQKIPS